MRESLALWRSLTRAERRGVIAGSVGGLMIVAVGVIVPALIF